MGGDWTGFTSIYSGVNGLFEGKDVVGTLRGGLSIHGSGKSRPNLDFRQYKDSAAPVGSAGRIAALGDTDNIPKWSRNQAVAMYYLNSINKITQQGSDRKGA